MDSIKVGLLGFGTIGTGVIRVLQKNADLLQQRLGKKLELAKVVDLDITTDRGVQLEAGLLSTDVEDIISNPDVDIAIELIGGYEPAKSFILKAIANGKHIVTANKALMALHGQEILVAAEENGVEVMFEAAVGGGIPVISAIKENLCANDFSNVLGILNGTCNYILTEMTENGSDFAPVLKDAQELGYAEADPTFDIEGVDTAHKIALLAALCFGTKVDFDKVYTEGITNVAAIDIQFATQMGYKIKLLAIGKNLGDQIEVRVHPTMIPDSYQLSEVDGVFNAVRLSGDFLGPALLYGSGAGMDATASAVMGDVMAIGRDMISGAKRRTPIMGYCSDQIDELPIKPMSDIISRYYLRFTVVDAPGVLAQISGILGKYDISIQSMIQPERHAADAVPIVIMTHEAKEDNINKALAEIDQLKIVQEPTRLIRVETNLG
ncbi:homoserine dehydrogenase [Malonomonas rubra DSM 5091]|uniref:Homoserine dehydrogenase n=1 Tax=Malonomonas rubra DSM 5091 TaxID=1122189 RepID=A0A1M6DDH2_MALRU|nr:homoserine dehydrogenase [Malonomonas rubra]SHI71091.1 homoserine dehydrogenase [Malonomonas rubra DSM 5091]